MCRGTILAIMIVSVAAVAGCNRQQAGTLQAAQETLGTANVRAVQFSGTGKWFQFGQAPSPTLPWPQFDVSSYTQTVNYETPAARVQITRMQTVEPGRTRPAPVEQRPDQYVSGTTAWNLAVPAGAPPGTPPAPQPQPAALEERVMEIWATPHGFLKAAAMNNATSTPQPNGGSEVTFTVGNNRYVGTINAQNHVERVQTWIDNSILATRRSSSPTPTIVTSTA